jgi:hypothetical protein
MPISLFSLWLPILLSAVAVFVVSSIVHRVLRYHDDDFRAAPNEDQLRAALKGMPPGNYSVPKPATSAERRSPAFQQKMSEGPLAFVTVLPEGGIGMTKPLIQWFVYCLVVGGFSAYVAGRTLPPGTDYLQVFRVTGTVGFVGYGLALVRESIWLGRNWPATLKSLFDALVYGLVTAGFFGWLWPKA